MRWFRRTKQTEQRATLDVNNGQSTVVLPLDPGATLVVDLDVAMDGDLGGTFSCSIPIRIISIDGGR